MLKAYVGERGGLYDPETNTFQLGSIRGIEPKKLAGGVGFQAFETRQQKATRLTDDSIDPQLLLRKPAVLLSPAELSMRVALFGNTVAKESYRNKE